MPQERRILKISQKIGKWKAAGQGSSDGPSSAREVLEEIELWLVHGGPSARHRKSVVDILDQLGRNSFLLSLGEQALLERWAEAAFKLIRASDFTLLDLFKLRLKEHPDKILFQDMSFSVALQWTYEQIDRKTREMAAAFLRLSSSRNPAPRVAIFCENRLGSACVDLACLFYDILDTPLNPHFNSENLIEIFDRLDIDIAVTDSRDHKNVLEQVRAAVAHPFRILTVERGVPVDDERDHFLDEYCARLSSDEIARALSARRRMAINEIATVMFTSGSTGKPKGVSFSLFNLVTKRFARAAALPLVGTDEVFLSFLPLYHTFGRFLELLGAIYWSGTYVFPGNPSLETLLALLPAIQPTGFISVPVRWAQIHEQCLEKIDAAGPSADPAALMREVVGGKLRWGLSAAGYLDPKVFRFFERNGVSIMSGFGMTEATGGITMTPPDNYVDNTHGLPLPGMRLKLAETGELLIGGPYVARYLEDFGPGDCVPFPDDGAGETWLPTGDVFQKLDNGFYRIIDRIKDIYKNNRGQTVAPLKVENKFHGVPGIRRTFLVGDGRPFNVLFIVPDYSDEVLKKALTEENEREYYKRIVSAANHDLAPYERVVNFSLLERDFDPARGELTSKGTPNRKIVERNFEREIEVLYRKNYVEIPAGGLRIRIPLWFYRDLGILEDDIVFVSGMLLCRTRETVLTVRKGGEAETWILGDLEYRITGDVADLGLFSRQPRLWIGNPSLVGFCPCREGWDLPLEGVADQVLLPQSRLQTYAPSELPDPERIGEGPVLGLNRLISAAFFSDGDDAIEAMEGLEEMFSEPDLKTSSVIRRRLEALSRHPDERIRCAAYRILLLDEPNPEYGKALSSFLYSGNSFLNDESIELIASSRIGEGRFEALRQRMCVYREQLEWPIDNVPRKQLGRILRIFVNLAVYHPEFTAEVRAEIASWALYDKDPILSSSARMFLDELIRTYRGKRPAPGKGNAMKAGSRPEPVFDEGIAEEEKVEILGILNEEGLLETSIDLSRESSEQSGGVAGTTGKIWISRLQTSESRRAFRIGVNTDNELHLDLRLYLDLPFDVPAVREAVLWHLAVAGYPYGKNVLPPAGDFLPGKGAFIVRHPVGLTVWERIEEYAAVRDQAGAPPSPGALRKLFIESLSAFFRAWIYSSRRIVPGMISPSNVAVPETDYGRESLILSLFGWKPYRGPLDLIRPMAVNFFDKTFSFYPWSGEEIDPNWIFDACYEALGHREASSFLAELRTALSLGDMEWPEGEILLKSLDGYLDDFHKNYVVPLPALNAIGRFKEWHLQNPMASPSDKEKAVLDVYRLYRLEHYPEIVRFYLYRHTYYAAGEERTRAAFDRLLEKMAVNLAKPALQFIELSDVQATLRKEDDRLAFSRMIFPRLRSHRGLEILKTGEEGKKRLVVRSFITDSAGFTYTFGETQNPAEIGRFYRLLFKENYPKKISEQDRHYVVKDDQERVIGGLCFRMIYKNVAFIDSMVVSSQHKKSGIGGAILEDFCGRMAGDGVNVVLTHSYLPEFFLHRGFKADKRWGAWVRYL